MKAKTKELINEMMFELRNDLEGIIEPKEKFDAKIKYVDLLFKMSTAKLDINESFTKEAIKEDVAKETVVEEDIEPEIETSSEEISLEEEVIKETEEELEPVFATTDDGEEIDISNAYYLLDELEDEEDRKAIAVFLTENNCVDEFSQDTLETLPCNTEKAYLAYYIRYCPNWLNEKVSEISSDLYNDIYEYINENNLEGFINDFIEPKFEEEYGSIEELQVEEDDE